MFRLSTPSARITLFVTIFPLVTLLFYGVSTNLFFINAQNKIIERDINNTKEYLMDMEKQYLKEKVESLSLLITLSADQQQKNDNDTIKKFVINTASIANNIYHKNQNFMDEESLKAIILSALKNTSFGKKIDYIFLLDLDGNILLHKDERLINTNGLNIKDVTGKYIILNFINMLEEKKEGFSRYYWYKENETSRKIYPKISYLKVLDAYDWFIGAGVPDYDVSLNSGKVILDYIEDNDRYKNASFYISDSVNNIIFNHNLEMDKDLLKYRIEGFYQDDRNIAFTQYLADQDWYVTVIKRLDGIQKNINEKKIESENIIHTKIENNIYFIIAAWFISLLLSLYLSRLIFNQLQKYKNTISDANNKLVFQSRQAAIGELLPMIAHQWRQPINKIASILLLMRFDIAEDKIDSEKLDEKCQKIENNIEFMSQTIEDFRTFYQPVKQATVEDIKYLIEKSVAFLEPKIRKKSVKVITPEEIVFCKLNSNEFMQVMINLIDNSIESVEDNEGEITISLSGSHEGNISVSVIDNGRGIPNDQLQKIFEPYFSSKEGSMGLGLYMSKMIIEKHLNGEISVESSTSGTRFEMLIPLITDSSD